MDHRKILRLSSTNLPTQPVLEVVDKCLHNSRKPRIFRLASECLKNGQLPAKKHLVTKTTGGYARELSSLAMEFWMMFKPFLTVCSVLLVLATQSFAQAASCTATVAEKRLAGAAKTSFLTKCERDATTVCETTATGRKLHGAARTSFTRKCVKDAVGEAAGA